MLLSVILPSFQTIFNDHFPAENVARRTKKPVGKVHKDRALLSSVATAAAKMALHRI